MSIAETSVRVAAVAPDYGDANSRRLRASADRSRAKVGRAFRLAFDAGRAALDVTTTELLAGSGFQHSLDAYLEKALTATEAALRASLPDVLLDAAARAGNAVRKVQLTQGKRAAKAGKQTMKVKTLMRFDKANPRAVEWASQHAAKLIVDVTDETRKAVRKVVARGVMKGINPRELSRILVNVVSMTEAQGNAVVNLHQTILTSPGKKVWAGKVPIRVPKEGISSSRLDSVLQAYADRLTKQRAVTIARTETIAAANKGQTLLWQQAQDEGLLPAAVKHAWIAAPSERTCPICEDLDGEEVEVGEDFSIGVQNPPAHVNCRCTTGMVA